MAFFSLLLVVAFLAWLDKGKWYYLALAAVAAALGMCSKENMPLILVTFGVFFLYLLWTRKITLPEKWIRDLIIAVIIFFGIIFTGYSSILDPSRHRFRRRTSFYCNRPLDVAKHNVVSRKSLLGTLRGASQWT